MKLHDCAVPGCNHQIRWDYLMCYHHWRLVPPATRLQVLESWNGGHPRPWYLDIRAAAIASVPAPRVELDAAPGGRPQP